MDIVIYIAIFLVSAIVFTFVGFFIRKKIAESKMRSAENEAKRIIEQIKKQKIQEKKKSLKQKKKL